MGEDSRAVLIGTHEGCTTFGAWAHDVPAVANNLNELRQVFTDGTVWDLPPGNCQVLSQTSPASVVLDAIHQAAAAATDTLVVYLSGHGFLDEDNRLFLLLPGASAYYHCLAYDDIRKAVRGRRARQAVIIVDCCWSGAAIPGALGAGDGDLEVALKTGTAIEGACVFTACSAHLLAMAPPGDKYTAYTGALLTVLTTGIEDGPRYLHAGAIHVAIKKLLAQRPGIPEPQFVAYNQGSEIILARNHANALLLEAQENGIPLEINEGHPPLSQMILPPVIGTYKGLEIRSERALLKLAKMLYEIDEGGVGGG